LTVHSRKLLQSASRRGGDDLLQRGIARESEGAVGVFSDGSLPLKEDPFLVNRDGEWTADPALVRKSDGGFQLHDD